MTFRIGVISELANLPEILVRYRVSDSSATGKNLRVMEINTLKIRKKYLFSSSYKPTLSDIIYNFFHCVSVFTIPGKWKLKIFSFLRDSS